MIRNKFFAVLLCLLCTVLTFAFVGCDLSDGPTESNGNAHLGGIIDTGASQNVPDNDENKDEIENNTDNKNETENKDDTDEEQEDNSLECSAKSKVLIAYFTLAENLDYDGKVATGASMTGSGDVYTLAEYIKQYTGGDLFSIKTVKKYPNDFDPVVD